MLERQDVAIADTPRPETDDRPLLSRTRALLPFSLVLLSLLSLASLHLLANHKTASLRNRISTVTEPSRALVTEIQSAMALETAAAHGSGCLEADHQPQRGVRFRESAGHSSAISNPFAIRTPGLSHRSHANFCRHVRRRGVCRHVDLAAARGELWMANPLGAG